MAQAAYEAYDLEHFTPAKKKEAAPPRVRVAKRQRSEHHQQVLKMARTILALGFILLLVSGVLYTQAKVTELQSEITRQRQALTEEEALNAYLSFELDNMTSLKNIEERAEAMGLEKVGSSQITYYRVEDVSDIEIRENTLAQIWQNARTALMSIFDITT